jgi:hypothetical protein
MTRGPNITRGLAFALPLALRRGHVMAFIPSFRNLADFIMVANGLFVLVRVRLARKLTAALAAIEAEFAETITGLRLIPRAGPVLCELWLYSRYGALRHFRVGDAGLAEIDCYGTPLDQVTISGAEPCRTAGSDPAQEPGTAGLSRSDSADSRDPILRWLKKWNSDRQAGVPAGGPAASSLKKILDAGKGGDRRNGAVQRTGKPV